MVGYVFHFCFVYKTSKSSFEKVKVQEFMKHTRHGMCMCVSKGLMNNLQKYFDKFMKDSS